MTRSSAGGSSGARSDFFCVVQRARVGCLVVVGRCKERRRMGVELLEGNTRDPD